MPKLRTVKAIAKRVRITKTKKFLVTPAGQNHFRARKTGSKKMEKRSHKLVAASDVRNIRRAVPHA